MPDDTRVCATCGKTYTNSGKNVLIQKNLLTGKDECTDCSFKEWQSSLEKPKD
jgi:DNA-directed RNA polymerase subunit RPC12/RpoP